jgi:WD40 repeat protein
LVIGLWDRNLVWIRDAQTGKRLLDPQTNRVGQTYSTQFSPDGRFLAMAGSVTSQDARFPATVGSEAGMQAEREVADGIKIWRLEGGGFNNMDGALKATLVRSWAEGSGLVFAPDSRSIAFSSVGLGSKVEYFYLWDFESSSEPKSVGFRGPGAVQGCDFTPDGHRLLAIDDDGAVVTTDVGTGEQISSFQVWNSQTMGVAGRSTQFLSLSPDGSRLAVSSPSRLGVEIRHPSTGEILYSLREEAGTVFWLAWSPDSRRIAVSRDNGNIAVWNLDIIDQTLAELGLNP